MISYYLIPLLFLLSLLSIPASQSKSNHFASGEVEQIQNNFSKFDKVMMIGGLIYTLILIPLEMYGMLLEQMGV
mgnify:CR=1 FL=1